MTLSVPVTLLYGALNALVVTLLGINISRIRGQKKIFVGDQIPPDMIFHSRAHGNAAEWVPLGIVLLLILELSGAKSLPLHLFGGGLLLGRVLHAAGLIGRIPTTAAAAGINYLVFLGMSIYALVLRF